MRFDKVISKMKGCNFFASQCRWVDDSWVVLAVHRIAACACKDHCSSGPQDHCLSL